MTEASSGTRLVLTVEQAAEQLGIGRTLMYKLVQSGQVHSIKIGRCRRIPLTHLHAFFERQLQPANSTPEEWPDQQQHSEPVKGAVFAEGRRYPVDPPERKG